MSVTCRTCNVSESFYSDKSIQGFRLEHTGHDVLDGGVESAGKVRLLKVMVELVMLPAYPSPVFTITGVKEDLKSAFVQVVSPSQRDQVKETLEKGKYLDSGSNDTVYVWEPTAITMSKDATLAMSFGDSSPVDSSDPEPSPAPEEPSQSTVPSPSGNPEEIEIATSGQEQSTLVISEAAPQAETPALLALPAPSVSDLPPNPSDSLAQPEALPPAPAQESSALAPSTPSLEPEAPKKPSSEPLEVSMPMQMPEGKEVVEAASSEGPNQQSDEEDNYLLVSKSWYIEKGPKNMKEAVRISRLLRPFRWRIEPAYTIGVMVDDILSVESANGEIGGDITKVVEGAGYEFSRVSVENGKPVAWFKKQQASQQVAPGN